MLHSIYTFGTTNDMNTVHWMTKKNGEVVGEDVLQLEQACPFCGKRALTMLPTWELAKQPDATNAVCNPALGGCNHGFEVAA